MITFHLKGKLFKNALGVKFIDPGHFETEKLPKTHFIRTSIMKPGVKGKWKSCRSVQVAASGGK